MPVGNKTIPVLAILLFCTIFVTELDVCVIVHHQYDDVSNQQDATTFSFINL